MQRCKMSGGPSMGWLLALWCAGVVGACIAVPGEERGSVSISSGQASRAAGRSTAALIADEDAISTQTVRFTDGTAPSDVTAESDVSFAEGTLSLSAADGEGYADVSFSPDELSGRNVVLVSGRTSSLVATDFKVSGGATCDTSIDTSTSTTVWGAGAIYEQTSSNYQVGTWLTYASDSSPPELLADGDDCYLGLDNSDNIGQAFLIDPGESYRLRFDADPTDLDDDCAFYVQFRYHSVNEASGDALSSANASIYYPTTSTSASGGFVTLSGAATEYIGTATSAATNYHIFRRDDVSGSKSLLYRLPDCDEHTVDATGTPTIALKQHIPSTTCETSLEAAFVIFKVACDTDSSDGLSPTDDDSAVYASEGTGTVTLRDVTVERQDQIEARIIGVDAGGAETELQTSYLDRFYVEAFDTTAYASVTVRLLLRSHSSSLVPTVDSLSVEGPAPLEVTVGSVLADFDEGRLWSNALRGTRSQYDNVDYDMDSRCLDPLTSTVVDCIDLGPTYDNPLNRFELWSTMVAVAESGGAYTFSLSTEGELWVERAIELSEAGQTIIGMFQKEGDVYYGAATTDVEDLPRSGAYATMTDVEFGQYITEERATFIADLFDGTHTQTVTIDGVTADHAVPLIAIWEVFNETNCASFDASWEDYDSCGCDEDTERAGLEAEVAGIIKAGIPSAEIAFAGYSPAGDTAFNTTDLSDWIAAWNAAGTSGNFSLTNFHPYTKNEPIDGRERLIRSRWEEAESVLSAGSLDTAPSLFTEFGETHEVYNPHCYFSDSDGYMDYSSTKYANAWYRGYGESEFSTLLARETLTLLGLPSKAVFLYGAGNYADESNGGYTTGGYDCWESDSGYQYNIWDYVSGGYRYDDHSPTSSPYFEPNGAGISQMVLAEYAGKSSPYEATWTLDSETEDALAERDEYSNVVVLKTGTNEFVVALWWYHAYQYDRDQLGYMNFLTGVADSGFTESLWQSLRVTGLGAQVMAATLVELDGTTSALDVSYDSATDTARIEAMAVGGEPVLVRIEVVYDNDADGYTEDTDCDDTSSSVYPGATETCNLVDDDCDGTVDDSAVDQRTFYADADRDGYGALARTRAGCRAPRGYVSDSSDCNDRRAEIGPPRTWYLDADNDGYGVSSTTLASCLRPTGYRVADGDCNDADRRAHPGAPDPPGGADHNCDGVP